MFDVPEFTCLLAWPRRAIEIRNKSETHFFSTVTISKKEEEKKKSKSVDDAKKVSLKWRENERAHEPQYIC